MTGSTANLEPLEISPAPQGHGFQWRRVFRLLREVLSAEDQVQAGLELVEAVGGMDGETHFQDFVRSPEGRRMLREQPDLVARLGDRRALATLPEGSLGRAYLSFAEENGFAADGLVEQNREVRRDRSPVDPLRRWFWDRFTMSHDLWHVLTGCPTTPEGESRLLWFSYAQNPTRGMRLLLLLVAYSAGFHLSRHWDHLLAWRAGKRAQKLSVARWEELLERPLEEVRTSFGVDELMA